MCQFILFVCLFLEVCPFKIEQPCLNISNLPSLLGIITTLNIPSSTCVCFIGIQSRGGDLVSTERGALRNGIKLNAIASRTAMGGSVRNTGGASFPTAYTPSSAIAHPTKGFRL